MTPTERVVARAIRQARCRVYAKAIMPVVLRRTGVSKSTYYRVLRLVNEEDR